MLLAWACLQGEIPSVSVFPVIGVPCVPPIPSCWWPWFPSCQGTAVGIALLLFLNYVCFFLPLQKKKSQLAARFELIALNKALLYYPPISLCG